MQTKHKKISKFNRKEKYPAVTQFPPPLPPTQKKLPLPKQAWWDRSLLKAACQLIRMEVSCEMSWRCLGKCKRVYMQSKQQSVKDTWRSDNNTRGWCFSGWDQMLIGCMPPQTCRKINSQCDQTQATTNLTLVKAFKVITSHVVENHFSCFLCTQIHNRYIRPNPESLMSWL